MNWRPIALALVISGTFFTNQGVGQGDDDLTVDSLEQVYEDLLLRMHRAYVATPESNLAAKLLTQPHLRALIKHYKSSLQDRQFGRWIENQWSRDQTLTAYEKHLRLLHNRPNRKLLNDLVTDGFLAGILLPPLNKEEAHMRLLGSIFSNYMYAAADSTRDDNLRRSFTGLALFVWTEALMRAAFVDTKLNSRHGQKLRETFWAASGFAQPLTFTTLEQLAGTNLYDLVKFYERELDSNDCHEGLASQ